MMVEFDLDGLDVDNLNGFDYPAPGNYHVEVIHVDEDGGRDGEAVVVDYEILAGTTPDQEGKTHRDFFSKSEAAQKRMLMLAVATKLTTPAELKERKEKGETCEIDFSQAVGRQLCIGLEEEEYEGKRRVKTGFRLWAVDSPSAKGIPLNAGKLRELSQSAGSSPTTEDPFGNDLF